MYRLDCGCVTEVTNDGRWQISEAREERHEYLWNQSSFVLCHYLSQMKSSSLLSYQTMKYKFNCISLVKFINFNLHQCALLGNMLESIVAYILTWPRHALLHICAELCRGEKGVAIFCNLIVLPVWLQPGFNDPPL